MTTVLLTPERDPTSRQQGYPLVALNCSGSLVGDYQLLNGKVPFVFRTTIPLFQARIPLFDRSMFLEANVF